MNILKQISLASLVLLSTSQCIEDSKRLYIGEVIETLALKEVLSQKHNPLVASFMAHIMTLHSDFYHGEDTNISIGDWILHMHTYGSMREYAINNTNSPNITACKFTWSIDTGKISGTGGIVNGDEYDVNAAALYFDNLFFKDQKDSEKLHQEHRNWSSNGEPIYLIRQQSEL